MDGLKVFDKKAYVLSGFSPGKFSFVSCAKSNVLPRKLIQMIKDGLLTDIEYDQAEKTLQLDVGAVVLTPGFISGTITNSGTVLKWLYRIYRPSWSYMVRNFPLNLPHGTSASAGYADP